jgi:hypothetical protein
MAGGAKMMQDITLNFGVSGEARRKLVKAVSAYKQIPSEYLLHMGLDRAP